MESKNQIDIVFILRLLALVLLLIAFLFVAHDIITSEKITHKVDCFDSKGNKIEGLVCEEKIFCGKIRITERCKQ